MGKLKNKEFAVRKGRYPRNRSLDIMKISWFGVEGSLDLALLSISQKAHGLFVLVSHCGLF